MKSPKPCTVLIFDPKWKIDKRHPLKRGEIVLFLGNIDNAPGHCAVAKSNGKVIWLVHPQDFRFPTDDEL